MEENIKKLIRQIRNYLGGVTKKTNSKISKEKKLKAIKLTIITGVVIVMVLGISLVTTVNSAQLEQDNLNSKLMELEGRLSTEEQAYKNLETENEELAVLKTEYESYKSKMSPYEDLEEAEAKAKKAELEKKAAEEEAKRKAEEEAEKAKAEEEAAAKKKAEEEEKARLEAEEAKGYETGTTFEQLARTPDDYILTKVKFSGKVVQVMEGDSATQIRFAVNDDYDTIIYAEISTELTDNNRILEDDYVTLSGYSMGLLTYDSTLGGEITIPSISVDKIDR